MNIFETSKIKSIAKGTIILRQGEICKIGCKVISGCLKSYVLDETGKEHIMQFAPEGWIGILLVSISSAQRSSKYGFIVGWSSVNASFKRVKLFI